MTLLVQVWFSHLVQLLWQTTIVAVVGIGLTRIAPGWGPRLRHAVLLVALAKFALPPMLPLPTGVFSAAPAVTELTLWSSLVRTGLRYPALLAVAMLVHAAGAAVALCAMVVQMYRLARMRRRSLPLPRTHGVAHGRILLRLSEECATPCTFGVFRPVVLLPATLVERVSPEALQDVIAHELEHVRRGDVVLNGLQALLGAIWWFHPAYRALDRELRCVREERCDDAVVAQRSALPRYARTLFETAQLCPSGSPIEARMGCDPHVLLRRVRRLAARDYVPGRRPGFAALLLVAALALALLPGLRVSHDNHYAFDAATWKALRPHHPSLHR